MTTKKVFIFTLPMILTGPTFGQTIYKCPSPTPGNPPIIQQMPCSPTGGGETMQVKPIPTGAESVLSDDAKEYMAERDKYKEKEQAAREAEEKRIANEANFIEYTASGNKEKVLSSLKSSINIDVKSNKGYTALMLASFDGNSEIVKALLEKGADVNVKSNQGYTALMLATLGGHTETVKALLGKGADVNVKSNQEGFTALIIASTEGHSEIVKALLDKGADVNVKPNQGVTALLGAVNRGHSEIVKALLDKGADVNVKNDQGHTALILALGGGLGGRRTEIVKILIDKGADVDDKYHGLTALMLAIGGGHTEIVKALLGKGADVNVKDDQGFTALMLAIGGGHTEIVKALLGKGADVNVKDDQGFTALMLAIGGGHTEIVKALLDKGADVNVKNEDGTVKFNKTIALEIASDKGYKEIEQLLLANGVDKELTVNPTTSAQPSSPKPKIHPACAGKDNNLCDAVIVMLNLQGKLCYRVINIVSLGNEIFDVTCEKASFDLSHVKYKLMR